MFTGTCSNKSPGSSKDVLIIDNQVKDSVAFRLELPVSQSANGSINPCEIKPPHQSILGVL